MGGQGTLDYIDYALRGGVRGEGVSIKMIMYYMIISARLIVKVVREKSYYNELAVTYNNLELFNLCFPLIITHSRPLVSAKILRFSSPFW